MRDTAMAHPRTAIRLTPLVNSGVLAVAVALLALAVLHNVNWDEFYFLALVHDYTAGRLDRPLQTFHVHLFQWLTRLPGDEMAQVLAGRLVMLGCLGLTTFCIYRISARLAGANAALLAILGFLTSGFVIGHGASFRADPLAACLLMLGFLLVMTTRMRAWQMLALAALVALACLVTIKSALYLPAFLGALLWRAEDRGVSLRALAAGIGAVALAGLGYLAHASGLSVAEGKDGASNAMNAVNTTLLSEGLLPRRGMVAMWLMFSIAPVLLASLGIIATRGARQRAALLLILAPVASLLVYRNAFPYFFPFIVPPLIVVASLGLAPLKSSARAAVIGLMLASGLIQAAFSLQEGNRAQHAVIDEAHRLFPEPVAYFGRNGMIASFPRKGPFMSSWGLQNYRRAGVPVFARQLDDDAPPLLIANTLAFTEILLPGSSGLPCCQLLEQDAAALRNAYVQHWGPIWLLGQEVELSGGAARIDILRAGAYRLVSQAPLTVNGQSAVPGQVLHLTAGAHPLTGPDGAMARLIWATPATDTTPPALTAPLYYGFWSL